jgi:hypothetical protein
LRPGLCKHLLSLKDQLRQKLSESQSDTMEGKMDEVVQRYPEFEITVHD